MIPASLRAKAPPSAPVLPGVAGGAGASVSRTRTGWTAALVAPAVVVATMPGAAAALAYDRARLPEQWWRAITCHWTHWTADHLVWDLLVFAILVPAGLAWCPRRTWLTLAAAVIAIPAAVHLALPELATYRGLSGLDSALFVLLAVVLAREHGWLAPSAVALAAFAAKLAIEAGDETTLFVEGGAFVPVPLAHAVGAACGALAGAFSRRAGRRPPAS